MLSSLNAISPVDGRYHSKTSDLAPYLSEYGLIYHRLLVEIKFLQSLCEAADVPECKSLSDQDNALLESLLDNFNEAEAQKVKDIEKQTNHDVKAVEYYLKEACQQSEVLKANSEFIHFGLTSEDVNNLAYALMLKGATQQVLIPKLHDCIDSITLLAKNNIDVAMMARTHGQPASPTTIGKEFINITARLTRSRDQLAQQQFLGKCNGAVGNYNALQFAYPEVDWPAFTKQFIEQKLQLTFNPYTTQIEPHDWIAELCHHFSRINTTMIDFSRDLWTYISLNYFKQKTISTEVGSSTMPHKVNPIDFENAEGNLGIANALLSFFANKLPISRLQRDLTDSTVLRNLGVAFGHSYLAYQSLLKGLSKLETNQAIIEQDLNQQWALLAEPIQTLMRRYGLENPYEQLKALTRGKTFDKESLDVFVDTLALPEKEKKRLKALTPSSYLGLAQSLTKAL